MDQPAIGDRHGVIAAQSQDQLVIAMRSTAIVYRGPTLVYMESIKATVSRVLIGLLNPDVHQ